MTFRWFPWKWIVRRAARSHGLIDPFRLVARLRKFAEPSEIDAPLELIRAWTVFQARGIVNTRAIQHNLDWVWPYWVERQFNPRDPSFVPRSFSLSHINLTHRNWTAVCVPDADLYSLVDPRGLVTPLHDGWSLDAWVIGAEKRLVPSRCPEARQAMDCAGGLAVETGVEQDGQRVTARVEMQRDGDRAPLLQVAWRARADAGAMLCVALRPYNPEGVQFIDDVAMLDDGPGWLVNGKTRVCLDRAPQRFVASTYRAGDVFNCLHEDDRAAEADCPVGMATAAALYPLDEKGRAEVAITVPVHRKPVLGPSRKYRCRPATSWPDLDRRCPALEAPDERMVYLYRAATRTLLSLSAGEVYPGSYTYRRFWFRDACLMLNALLALNQEECCRRALEDSFVRRQTIRGFFESQQGEWDSNGQVLWLAERYSAMTGRQLSETVLETLRKGAEWLCRKRLPDAPDQPYRGLLPSGFSAEHLGPNNYYYWDNFWGLAGLHSAARTFRRAGDSEYADRLRAVADGYERCILDSIAQLPESRCGGAIPAAPGRRMDAGAVGSIVADYPLQLFAPADAHIMKTVEFLLKACMIDHGFFHDMTHSGINAYLTLHLAQVLLRAGDARYLALVRRVAELASPTGQWPEAIHPATGGGCMGDGQHGWAAAEWVLMMRSLFIREEKDGLVIGAGLPDTWLDSGEHLCFGPTPTVFGPVRVSVTPDGEAFAVVVEGAWRGDPPKVDLALGRRHATLDVRASS